MRRPARTLAVLAILASAAACSKHDQRSAAHDAQHASQSAERAVTDVGHNPAVKRAVTDARLIGHKAAVEVRHTASQADAALHRLATSTDRATRDHKDQTNSASDSSS